MSTGEQGDEGPQRLADFLPYQLSVTSNAVSELIAREYRERFELKIPEWRIMAVLGDTGETTQRGLVDATRMDKVTVNRCCKALEERGLVTRAPNAADGRSHLMALSAEGADLYGKIMPLAREMERRLIGALTAAERRRLDALLTKLLDRADEEAGRD